MRPPRRNAGAGEPYHRGIAWRPCFCRDDPYYAETTPNRQLVSTSMLLELGLEETKRKKKNLTSNLACRPVAGPADLPR